MVIKRWRRYGNDRLYVTADDGTDLGWWDLVADRAHASSDATLPRLTDAVSAWRADLPQATTSTAPTTPGMVEPALEPSAAPAFVPPEFSPAPHRAQQPSVDVPSPPVEASPPSPESSTPTPDRPAQPPVMDLLSNSSGQQLAGEIAAAHAAGMRPTLLRRFFLGKHAYSTWERGAIGERLVADELAALVRKDPRWGFIHSIPVGTKGSDIDHLVIGPGGVFSLNTKYHKGCNIWVGGETVMVNGARQPYVRNSRHEANRVGRLLSAASGLEVIATGLVVPVAAARFTVKRQPDDIRVVNRRRLVRFLRQTPDVLNPDAVATLFEYARLSSTWTGHKMRPEAAYPNP